MEVVIKSRSPVAAVSHGLVHQFMCAAAMVGAHAVASYSEIAMRTVMHPVTNVAMMGMAGWCWWRGDKSWLERRGELASSFEKVSMRGLIAAAGLGMMAMHVPGQSNPMMHHDMQGSHRMYSQSLEDMPPQLKVEILKSPRSNYLSLPADLKERVDNEARREGIQPEIFVMGCSQGDQLSRDISAFLTERAHKNMETPDSQVALKTSLASTNPEPK